MNADTIALVVQAAYQLGYDKGSVSAMSAAIAVTLVSCIVGWISFEAGVMCERRTR